MKELFLELGFTETTYRNTNITRRCLLQLTSLALVSVLSACSTIRGRVRVTVDIDDLGDHSPIDGSLDITNRNKLIVMKEWTPQEVVDFGASMESEPEFNDIAYAGRVLWESHFRRVSLSKLSELFINEPVGIKTVKNIGEYTGKGTWEPTDNTMVRRQPNATFTLQDADGSTTVFSGPSVLQLDEILIDGPLTGKFSDFILRFHVAKELFKVQALGRALVYARSINIDPKYYIPNSLLLRNAVTIGRISDTIKGVSTIELAKILANFYMLPNYLLAVDRGRISRGDWGDDYGVSYEALFRKSADMFQDQGILFKNSSGMYEWNLSEVWEAWINEAASVYSDRLLFPITPSPDRIAG